MDKYSFIEVNTPILRKGTNEIFRRHEVNFVKEQINQTAYLRDSMECALRSSLQHHDKVFEIGACFRLDSPSATHYPEFYLHEVYALDVNLSFLMNIVSEIISQSFALQNISCTINKVSVKNYFQSSLNIDIAVSDGNELKARIISANCGQYLSLTKQPHYQTVNKFIAENIENIPGINILYDYPDCTISTAKRKGTTHVIERFEVFVDGLEICNAYLDETNIDDMIKRSRDVNLYNYEEKRIVQLINENLLSSNSGGFGIGIERLCSAITKSTIDEFIIAKDFNFISQINQ